MTDHYANSILAEQIFVQWAKGKASFSMPDYLRAAESPMESTQPATILAQYRALTDSREISPATTYDFNPDPNETRRLRQMMGLPTQGPVNVVLLFIESFRAYEFEHPQIGPKIFLHLRKIFN